MPKPADRRSAARPRVETFGTIGSSTAAGPVQMLGAPRLRSGRKASEDTMTDLEPSGFSHIDHLLQLVGRTRELLDAVVSEGGLPVGGADYLADTTLPHLEGVEAGFHGSLRSEHAGLPELRYLLEQVGALRVTAPRTEAEVEARDGRGAGGVRRARLAGPCSEASPRASRALEPRRAGTRPAGSRVPAATPRMGRPFSRRAAYIRGHRRAARAGRAFGSDLRDRAPAVACRDGPAGPDAGPRISPDLRIF